MYCLLWVLYVLTVFILLLFSLHNLPWGVLYVWKEWIYTCKCEQVLITFLTLKMHNCTFQQPYSGLDIYSWGQELTYSHYRHECQGNSFHGFFKLFFSPWETMIVQHSKKNRICAQVKILIGLTEINRSIQGQNYTYFSQKSTYSPLNIRWMPLKFHLEHMVVFGRYQSTSGIIMVGYLTALVGWIGRVFSSTDRWLST